MLYLQWPATVLKRNPMSQQVQLQYDNGSTEWMKATFGESVLKATLALSMQGVRSYQDSQHVNITKLQILKLRKGRC